MKVWSWVFYLFWAQVSFAELSTGYPSQIETSNFGTSFKVACLPDNISAFEEIKNILGDFWTVLDSIQCDVKKLRNPFYKCAVISNSSTACSLSENKIVQIKKEHPNYLGLINLIQTAYLSKNNLKFDLLKIQENSEAKIYSLIKAQLGQ